MNNLPEQKMQLQTTEESIDFKKIFNKMLDRWYWYLASILIFLGISLLYIHVTSPTYMVNSQLLVNNNDKGGGLGKQASSLMDLGGLMGSSNSVDNETGILKTRFLMERVVRDLQLNIIYTQKINFAVRELDNPPFKLKIIEGLDTIKRNVVKITLVSAGKVKVSTDGFSKDVTWSEAFQVPGIGKLQLLPQFGARVPEGDFEVIIDSIDQRVSDLMEQLTVDQPNKQSTIIELGFVYTLPKKGEEILNTLIKKYVSENLNDKNSVADSTSKFIKERLNIISGELGDVENKVQDFKQSNNLADMTEQGKLLVKNTGEFSADLAKAETQVTVLNDLEDYLKDKSKNKRVFPTSLLPSDMVFSGLMEQYNTLLIERDKQLLSVKEGSPFIENIDNQIAGLRSGILSNIQSTKNTFVVTRDKLRSQLKQVEGKISGVPQIEKNYLKLARNQQIKQELYIFLMQKSEETAISKTANVAVAKVIDPPKAETTPVSPKKKVIYILSIFLGLILPTIVILIGDLMNTTIDTKEDITNLSLVPILGEISHNSSEDNMIVANQGRSAISEQFRALRTNLSFYLTEESQKVILLTSSMSGEGKSFTAINLANILALSGKKVLLMELDLRKPGLSGKLNINNTMGFSNYVIDPKISINDIIKPLPINPNMFIIPSGPLPPNPAETLMSEQTALLMTELKGRFDFIIVDAPPIGIITDAQLLSRYADVILYLVRQKKTQRKQLDIVNDLYKTNKMGNIGIVVNDIISKNYGYGYGYGDYGQEQHTTFAGKIKKFFTRS